jgi:hypothetical protein
MNLVGTFGLAPADSPKGYSARSFIIASFWLVKFYLQKILPDRRTSVPCRALYQKFYFLGWAPKKKFLAPFLSRQGAPGRGSWLVIKKNVLKKLAYNQLTRIRGASGGTCLFIDAQTSDAKKSED